MCIRDSFQQTRALPWEEWIPPDGKFTVNCTTVKSVLRSEPACQKTVKKAIVEHLGEIYMMDTFPETGAEYTVKAVSYTHLLSDAAVFKRRHLRTTGRREDALFFCDERPLRSIRHLHERKNPFTMESRQLLLCFFTH